MEGQIEESASIFIETFIAVLLFSFIFLFGNRLRVPAALVKDHHNVISFGAGMSMAYVFVHLMPELHGAREAFIESVSVELRYEGMAIYFLALIGFLTFYGIDHLRGKIRETGEHKREETEFKLHVGGFAFYVALVAYLLVHNLEETSISVAMYALAISFHLLAVDNEFRREYAHLYVQKGRFLLAGAALAGWGIGQVLALPLIATAMLVAFISGAVIMNSALMELRSDKDGRFLPFMSGGLIYGLVLLPLG